MRLVVLTSSRRGAASLFLPALVARPEIEVVLALFGRGVPASRRTRWRRKLRKIRRIGPLGAATGLFLRRWNDAVQARDLAEVAAELGLRFESAPRLASDPARELIREADADLGVTLGTPIIPPSVFEIPRWGMINVHGDVLPRFRGGASVLWPIHEGLAEAGFTVHQIDRGIDTGAILRVERFPIRFERTLRETYRTNVAEIQRRVPEVLAEVIARYPEYRERARPQHPGEGTTYTTPTLGQFLRMLRQHRRLRRSASER